MDKKRIIKVILTVCFVLVCGALYLVFCSPFGKQDEIMFEKQSEVLQSEPGADEGGGFPNLKETVAGEAGGDSEEDIPEEETEVMLYVHVCGAVLAEGVYVLPVGSRVTDGIIAAGGFREDADVTFHNLAALLTDGQKIYVPTSDETKAISLQERTTDGNESMLGMAGASGNGTGNKVNLNTAGLAELMTLNGIGEAKAESILKYREKVGRFQNIEELKNVSGIGEAMFERIRDDIIVE